MSREPEDSQSIIVSDASHTLSSSTFDPTKFLKVTFVGEPAVDEGGPPRGELFHLLTQSAVSVSGDHLVPIHSLEALSSNKLYIIGKIFATAIVQGGLAPFCFAKPVADFLLFGAVKSLVDLQDIPEFDIIQSVMKVCLDCILCSIYTII